MKRLIVLAVGSLPVFLTACMTYPAYVYGGPAAVVQPAPVTVEPYPVVERGATILIDPEDYYYFLGGRYYHHHYAQRADIKVDAVPPGYHYLQHRIDLRAVPQGHFHHPDVYYRYHPDARPAPTRHTPDEGRPIPRERRPGY